MILVVCLVARLQKHQYRPAMPMWEANFGCCSVRISGRVASQARVSIKMEHVRIHWGMRQSGESRSPIHWLDWSLEIPTGERIQ